MDKLICFSPSRAELSTLSKS